MYAIRSYYVSEEDYLAVRETLSTSGYRRLWLGGAARDIDQVRPSELLVA